MSWFVKYQVVVQEYRQAIYEKDELDLVDFIYAKHDDYINN